MPWNVAQVFLTHLRAPCPLPLPRRNLIASTLQTCANEPPGRQEQSTCAWRKTSDLVGLLADRRKASGLGLNTQCGPESSTTRAHNADPPTF